ncbi:MAG: alcohol dehydrogenase catalytic domain-containing protein, partial [Planctomycetota bacterium]
HAVQLIGPDKLIFNDSKEVFRPGPYQFLAKVEAVGLCFSDLKLLKQFSTHVRKTETLSGIDLNILNNMPSYAPGDKPTVPGHETVVRIVEVGTEVKNIKPGGRYLVQTDYRWLKNETANASFGYNIEGALQEYILLDERVVTSPKGESMFLPASENLSASAIALAEPWACVEDAYVSTERQRLTSNSQMLITADVEFDDNVLANLFNNYGKPAQITWISKSPPPRGLNAPINTADDISQIPDTSFDDILYFGYNAKKVESLFPKIRNKGMINIILGGGKFNTDINMPVGRTHYGGIRVIGTTGSDPSESMKTIPPTDEIRPNDRINVVGAGGPMGTMHTIRNICQGVKAVTVFAGDVDDERLAVLSKIASPLAEKNKVTFKTYNPTKEKVAESFDYTAIMAPVPALVASAIKSTAKSGVINIFAGIPATVSGQIDLDTYIEKQLFLIGTSGSTLNDMKTVLAKVDSGRLDTDISVGAVCGLNAAVEGIRAVENRSISGKILVYPVCKGLEITKLEDMKTKLPNVAKHLKKGLWNKNAEDALLKEFQQNQ